MSRVAAPALPARPQNLRQVELLAVLPTSAHVQVIGGSLGAMWHILSTACSANVWLRASHRLAVYIRHYQCFLLMRRPISGLVPT